MTTTPNFEMRKEEAEAEDRMMTKEELRVMEKEIEEFVQQLAALEKAGLVKIELAPSATEGFSTVTVRDAVTDDVIFYEDFGITHKVLDLLLSDLS